MDIKPCIEEIIQVCDKHGLVLSHEDSQGGFQFIKKNSLEGQNHARSGKPMVDIYHDWLREAELE